MLPRGCDRPTWSGCRQGGEPLPRFVDQGGERLGGSGVVDHVVGASQALLTGGLAGDPGPGVLFGHAPVGDEACHGHVDRAVDHEQAREVAPRLGRLDEEGHVEHDHGVGPGVGGD